jgi:dihydrofolate reductase
MIVSQIAAMAKNRSIGLDNNLPWHIPEDMKFFRDTTKDRICIYGRKTYESLGYKPFPKRPNIVISRNPDQVPNKEAVIVVSSLEAALEVARGQTDKWGQEVFICGGAEIYKLAIPFSDRIYLTEIHKDYPGDAFFPEFDKTVFKEVYRSKRTDPEPFDFVTYEKDGTSSKF